MNVTAMLGRAALQHLAKFFQVVPIISDDFGGSVARFVVDDHQLHAECRSENGQISAVLIMIIVLDTRARVHRQADVAGIGVVSNVQVVDVLDDEVKVRSRFIVYTNRLHDEVNLFVGKRDDVLRRDSATGWKIAKRTIILDQNVLLAKVITTFF